MINFILTGKLWQNTMIELRLIKGDLHYPRNPLVGWLFGYNGPLRQYFSLYSGRLPERGRKKNNDR